MLGMILAEATGLGVMGACLGAAIAAIGAGIDISRPCGNMIVDIGGGTSDIAVISLGGTVVSASIKIAGDDFDQSGSAPGQQTEEVPVNDAE